MSSRIVAYSYSHEGTAATGSTHPRHNSTATLAVIEESDPGSTVYARSTTSIPFYLPTGSDQCAAWATVLNANTTSGGPYSITYDAGSRRVTIASGGAAFIPVMVGDMATWLGFTQTLAGYADTWTGESAPAAVAELIAATVEPAEDNARIDLHQYRHGRAVAVAWSNHQLHRVQLFLDSAASQAFDPGYLMTGRVVILTGDATAYSPTNIDGKIDGFVVATTDVTESDDIGGTWSVSMVVAVPRGA